MINGSHRTVFRGVIHDSRQVKAGHLFVAIPGEKTDGHRYLQSAADSGAAGALVERQPDAVPDHPFAVVQVSDSVVALGSIARAWMDSLNVWTVAITGSVGKTTTKDLTAAVLSEKTGVHKTTGNYNTDVGVPLTMFQLRHHHRALVVEVAMRARGEIDYLARLVHPRIAVITNIGSTHLEQLGSREEIARAKGELYQMLPADGTAVVNLDDQRVVDQMLHHQGPTVTFGFSQQAMIRGSAVEVDASAGVTRFTLSTPGGTARVEIPVLGAHHAGNALAAAGVGWAAGLNTGAIARGLRQVELTQGRMAVKQLAAIQLIDDTYNASPRSVKAALQVLTELAGPGHRVAVLGDMLELGSYFEEAHRSVGRQVAQTVDRLMVCGKGGGLIAEAAREAGLPAAKIQGFDDSRQAASEVGTVVNAGDTVLVKGSRGMKMERVITGLKVLAGEED